MEILELESQLEAIMANGTEAEAMNFIVEHFKEFPEATQRELAVGLFADALQEDLAKREALIELKKKAVDAIDAFEASEKVAD